MRNQTPDQVATERMMMIMPLLEEGLSRDDLIARKKEICTKYDISYRTIGRYLDAYNVSGFEGLKPKTGYQRNDSVLPDDFAQILEDAIVLRRENPSRCICQVKTGPPNQLKNGPLK